MTIENIDRIDGAGISNETGEAVLLISDHLEWIDEEFHFRLIEKKISSYIDFVNSGQLLEAIPKAQGRPIRIDLVCQHQPNELALKFLSAAKQQLGEMGIHLTYGVLPDNY